ncbi:hypothetical protein K3495_g9417 [Podosphaera aphanis]|nr:hypothetical protein K3495_g9417 [Podosphaera aphanis]
MIKTPKNKKKKLAANVACLSAGVFLAAVRRAWRVNNEASKRFAVTLADIQKALSPDKKSSANLDKLPSQYKKFVDLFRKEIILSRKGLECDRHFATGVLANNFQSEAFWLSLFLKRYPSIFMYYGYEKS